MNLRNTPDAYGAVSQLLHWIIVALLVTQYTLAALLDDAPVATKMTLGPWHESFGILVLILACCRLYWRLANAVPEAPSSMPRWQHAIARLTHGALYACLFLQPLSGWLMVSAHGTEVNVFGIFTLPALMTASEHNVEVMRQVHEFFAATTFNIVLIHALAALKHHFYDRDNVLRRMLPLNRD